jgi:hypothetical protein
MIPSLRRTLLLALQIAALGSSLSQTVIADDADEKKWIVPCVSAVTKGYIHGAESCEMSFKKAFQKMGCGPTKPACKQGDREEIECELEVSKRCQGLPPGKEICADGFETRKIKWSKSHELKFCQPDDGDSQRNREMFDSTEVRTKRERERQGVEEGNK